MKRIIIFSVIALIIASIPITSEEDTMETTDLKSLAQSVQKLVVEWRRFIHGNPGLRFTPEETAILAFIRTEIEKISLADGIKIEFWPSLEGGLVVDVTVNSEFNRILFRADIDALPIQEETGLLFASRYPGVMHACGHDTHVAMLLGALKLILEGKVELKYNLRFVFQRAEENPIDGRSGGKILTEKTSVCKGIDYAYALHIKSDWEVGKFFACPDNSHANSDRMKIIVNCAGGHVMNPHIGSNAIIIAAKIVSALEGFGAQHVEPLESIIIEPGISNSGTASNIRPDKAELWYSVRHFFNSEKRGDLQNALTKKIQAVVSAYPDAKVEITHILGHPAFSNNREKVKEIDTLLLKSANEELIEIKPSFGGEDFAYYLRKCRGAFVYLGAQQAKSGRHHTDTFNPDESVFEKGVLFWLLLATN